MPRCTALPGRTLDRRISFAHRESGPARTWTSAPLPGFSTAVTEAGVGLYYSTER